MIEFTEEDYEYCVKNVRNFEKLYTEGRESDDRTIFLTAISDEIIYDGFDMNYDLTDKGNKLQFIYDKYIFA